MTINGRLVEWMFELFELRIRSQRTRSRWRWNQCRAELWRQLQQIRHRDVSGVDKITETQRSRDRAPPPQWSSGSVTSCSACGNMSVSESHFSGTFWPDMSFSSVTSDRKWSHGGVLWLFSVSVWAYLSEWNVPWVICRGPVTSPCSKPAVLSQTCDWACGGGSGTTQRI